MKKLIIVLMIGLLIPAISYEKTTGKYKKAVHKKITKKIAPVVKEKLKVIQAQKVDSPAKPGNDVAEKVAPPKVVTSSFYASSAVQRPLVLPQGFIDSQAQLSYHYFTSDNLGANLYLKGRYSRFQDWEFTGETSVFPQTERGFEFGGLRAGFLYRPLIEDAQNPEVALGLKIGVFGKGAYSLTKNNSFAAFPSVALRKQVLDRLSLQGELMPGIGNKEVGLASLNTLGIFKVTPDFDARLKLDLQNLGYSFDEIMSLTPAVEYHLNKDVDVLGGVQIGLLGANMIGNNFFLGAAKRF